MSTTEQSHIKVAQERATTDAQTVNTQGRPTPDVAADAWRAVDAGPILEVLGKPHLDARTHTERLMVLLASYAPDELLACVMAEGDPGAVAQTVAMCEQLAEFHTGMRDLMEAVKARVEWACDATRRTPGAVN